MIPKWFVSDVPVKIKTFNWEKNAHDERVQYSFKANFFFINIQTFLHCLKMFYLNIQISICSLKHTV